MVELKRRNLQSGGGLWRLRILRCTLKKSLNRRRAKALSDSYIYCMKMKIVDCAEKKTVLARNGTKTIWKWSVLVVFVLLSVTFGVGGCDEYYGAYPGYGPYYRGYAPYGPGYAAYPGYGPYAGSVTVEVGDRPYYTRGPGYYVGRSYYVWRPGHWARRNGRRVWIHGRYAVRG